MKLQLQRVYFEHFHPLWPLLHREVYETTAQPNLLTRSVLTVGLWFSGSPGSRNLAIKFHDHLLIETGNKLVCFVHLLLAAPAPPFIFCSFSRELVFIGFYGKKMLRKNLPRTSCLSKLRMDN